MINTPKNSHKTAMIPLNPKEQDTTEQQAAGPKQIKKAKYLLKITRQISKRLTHKIVRVVWLKSKNARKRVNLFLAFKAFKINSY
jgi:hypothetical protein